MTTHTPEELRTQTQPKGTTMTYVPNQLVEHIPNDHELPASTHAAAEACRVLDDREVDCEMRVAQLEHDIAEARNADRIAAERAVDAGKPVPVPMDKLERLATDAHSAAQAELLMIRLRKVKAGEAFIAALTAARDEYADRSLDAVRSAAEAYAEALAAASSHLSELAQTLEVATSGISAVRSLDDGAPHGLNTATAVVTVPSLAPAQADLGGCLPGQRIRQRPEPGPVSDDADCARPARDRPPPPGHTTPFDPFS